MAALWSLTRAAAKLSLFQDNDLSNSTPCRVECRTEAVNHLSRSLETRKVLKNILSKLKFIKYQNQLYHTRICLNISLAMYGLPSNIKSSSHKTWQTSLLFLKPLQIQNLNIKKGWTWHIISPDWKSGRTRSPSPPPNFAHATYYGPSTP